MVLWMSTEFERTNIFLPFKWWAALSPECRASCRRVLDGQGYTLGHLCNQEDTVAFMQYSAGPLMLQSSSVSTGESAAAPGADQQDSALSSPDRIGEGLGTDTGHQQLAMEHGHAIDPQLDTICGAAQPARITARPCSPGWRVNPTSACSMVRAGIQHDFQLESGTGSGTSATFTGALYLEAQRAGKDGCLWLQGIQGEIECQDSQVQRSIILEEVSVHGRFLPTPEGKGS